MKEYPLYEHHGLCPNARYVGGVSRHLCECEKPSDCRGVQMVLLDARIEELRAIAKGFGYASMRASHNLEELKKLPEHELLSAFITWRNEGSVQ